MSEIAKAPNLSDQNFAWVDNAKALLIFLVIIGHFSIVPARAVIYAFHVPAFLFITGFLLPAGFGKLTPSAVFQRWTAVHLRAYFLFSAVSIALWWVGSSWIAGHPINVMPAIRGTLYGVGGDDGGLVHENGPLWYFPFLAVSLAGAWLCMRLPPVAGWLLAAVWAVFAVSYHGPRLPWCLDISGVGVLTVIAGHRVRQNWSRIKPWMTSGRQVLAASMVFALLLLILVKLNGLANLNRDQFGQSGILFMLALAAGIAMTVAISSLDRPGPMRRTISRETLTIFAVHIYMVHRLNDVIPQDGSFLMRLAVSLGAGTAVLLVSLGIALAARPMIELMILPQKRRA